MRIIESKEKERIQYFMDMVNREDLKELFS